MLRKAKISALKRRIAAQFGAQYEKAWLMVYDWAVQMSAPSRDKIRAKAHCPTYA